MYIIGPRKVGEQTIIKFLIKPGHAGSIILSSIINPKPKGLPSHCLLKQA